MWMAVIFNFSSQPYKKQDLRPWIQENISGTLIREQYSGVILHYGGHEVSIHSLGVPGFVEFFIRKVAHFIEFGLFGFLLMLALESTVKINKSMLLGVALIVSAAYAASDEFHQSITHDRTPLVSDVILDTTSATIGVLLFLSIWFAKKMWMERLLKPQ